MIFMGLLVMYFKAVIFYLFIYTIKAFAPPYLRTCSDLASWTGRTLIPTDRRNKSAGATR